jgi:hypothetical protein
MKKELVHSLTGNFEDHAQRTEGGVEFWLARDLQHLSMIRSKDITQVIQRSLEDSTKETKRDIF